MQTDPGLVYGLDLGLRVGVGLEGVIGDSGDGLPFAQIGLHSDSSSTNRIVNGGVAGVGGALLATIPSRTGLSTRVRMPFYLVPGDLLLAAPLYLIAPQAYSKRAVNARNGGLIPWQLGMSTGIGRFQFVLDQPELVGAVPVLRRRRRALRPFGGDTCRRSDAEARPGVLARPAHGLRLAPRVPGRPAPAPTTATRSAATTSGPRRHAAAGRRPARRRAA